MPEAPPITRSAVAGYGLVLTACVPGTSVIPAEPDPVRSGPRKIPWLSGQAMGHQIQALVPGGGEIVIFAATMGTGDLEPRYLGAVSVLGRSYSVSQIGTSTVDATELATEKSYLLANKSALKGAFAVDSGRAAGPAGHRHRRDRADPGQPQPVPEEQPVPGRIAGPAVPPAALGCHRPAGGDHEHVMSCPREAGQAGPVLAVTGTKRRSQR